MLSQTVDDLPPSAGGSPICFEEDTPLQIDGADLPLGSGSRTRRRRWHWVVPLGARRWPMKHLRCLLTVLRRKGVLGGREGRLRLRPGRRHVGNRWPRKLLMDWARWSLDLDHCNDFSIPLRLPSVDGEGNNIHSSLIIFLISSRDGGCCPGTPGALAISGLPWDGPGNPRSLGFPTLAALLSRVFSSISPSDSSYDSFSESLSVKSSSWASWTVGRGGGA